MAKPKSVVKSTKINKGESADTSSTVEAPESPTAETPDVTPAAASTVEAPVEAVSKGHIQIVVLPPYFKMPTGHICRVATDPEGKVLWAKHTEHSDTGEFNEAWSLVVKAAGAKGYHWNQFVNCYGSYQSARRDFDRDPLGVTKKLMTIKPRPSVEANKDSF